MLRLLRSVTFFAGVAVSHSCDFLQSSDLQELITITQQNWDVTCNTLRPRPETKGSALKSRSFWSLSGQRTSAIAGGVQTILHRHCTPLYPLSSHPV